MVGVREGLNFGLGKFIFWSNVKHDIETYRRDDTSAKLKTLTIREVRDDTVPRHKTSTKLVFKADITRLRLHRTFAEQQRR